MMVGFKCDKIDDTNKILQKIGIIEFIEFGSDFHNVTDMANISVYMNSQSLENAQPG